MRFSLKQFITALCVAAWYSCRAQGGCLSKAKGVLVALFSREARVPQDIQDRRAKVCLSCPIFDKKRQTCGNAIEDKKIWNATEPPLGCYCYMPVKIKTQCNCWLYDETEGEMGWKRNLNSFPHEQR